MDRERIHYDAQEIELMALTLNNFVGFETGGLEEAADTNGSPAIVTTIVRTGSYALDANSNNAFSVNPFESVSDAGGDQIVAFAVYILDTTPASQVIFFRAVEDNTTTAGFVAFSLNLETDGDLEIQFQGGDPEIISTPFTDNTWHYIEILWQVSNSGTFDIFIDGSAAASQFTGKDTIGSGTFDRYYLSGGGVSDFRFDDIYCMSDATGTSDFLGVKTEVLGGYQNTIEDATDQGSALNNGTWANVGQTPFADGTQADYQQTAAIEGFTICDEGNRAGPAGDAPGTITGAKYIQRLNRTNGSSPTTLDKSFGNSVDGVTAVDVASALTVAFANFFEVSEAAGVVPTNSENFAMGMGQTGSGGRDIGSHEMTAMLLHTQPALSTTLADMNFPDQNYYLGPFGT